MAIETAVYLIPVTLGDTDIDRVLPPYNAFIIGGIRHFIVENVRTARRFLKKVNAAINIDSLTFYELNQHTSPDVVASYLDPIKAGEPVGILSEAGCPAVADPGAVVVDWAQRQGVKVIPLVGPSSILLGVMVSGFNGQSFAFHGYLPIADAERAARIRQLENRAYAESQTQIFIETPYRNVALMTDLLRTLRPRTRLCLAADLTCADEQARTRTVAEWRKLLNDHTPQEVWGKIVPRVPSIFLLYK